METTTMVLKIGSRKTVHVGSLEEASRVYCEERRASGEGGSTFPEGRVFCDGRRSPRYRVSYNGRVWAWKKWEPGDRPVLEAQG